MRKLFAVALISAAALSADAVSLQAQAGNYPALQPTRIAEREYNFALADFDGGTALLMQWREGLDNSRLQFTGDLGLADFANDAGVIIGGAMNYQLTRSNGEFPFDMVLGGGLGVTLVDNFNIFRIPVGVAIGHRFPLERNYAITPYVHPRLSFDRVSTDGPGGDATDTNLDVDVGGTFEINTQMQVRLAATLGDRSAVGISFAWLPRGLR